jgi:hypothetical protein
MDTVLLSVMYYACFKRDLLKPNVNTLPTNAFGVFTTVRRHQTLTKWPEDIHGCIGYWDSEFKAISPTTLYDHLLRVSHDAIWTDSRRTYFSPIEQDPQSHLELDFMMLPLSPINAGTGKLPNKKPFQNDTYGLIIQQASTGKKATYLPKVFHNKTWPDLLASIKEKASIEGDDYELYAYTIQQITGPLIDIVGKPLVPRTILYRFVKMMIYIMNIRIIFPFPYSCKDNAFRWSDDEVRNIATMGDIVKYASLFSLPKRDTAKLQRSVQSILDTQDAYSAQALSFLGHTFQEVSKEHTKFCAKLVRELPDADDEFGKPEILIGLRKAGCLFQLPPLATSDSIFNRNWMIQTYVAYQKPIPKQMIKGLVKTVQGLLIKKETTETNYLATAFEALSYINQKHTHDTLLFQLFFELEQRKTCHNHLYAFLDKTARVDITGHVLNGLYELLTN